MLSKARHYFNSTVWLILVAFFTTGLNIPSVFAQAMVLPTPGVRVALSPQFTPAIIRGMTIDAKNPFAFSFLVDQGDAPVAQGQKKEAYEKLIKYFLAAMTIAEDKQWVNLSPYEKDRIIDGDFGKTEMGRDLLGQDYMLKQITASLLYPEEGLGKAFWQRVYKEAAEKFGTTQIPVNTFNKVWILPETASVYEKDHTVLVVESKLKVMLEEDYLATSHAVIPSVSGVIPAKPPHSGGSQRSAGIQGSKGIAKQVLLDIVIPALTKEVNEGKNFANLRQIYNSMILATWYKQALKQSILAKIYANKSKVKGVDLSDPSKAQQEVYQQYLAAFKKGAYNFIKEEPDPVSGEIVPRKYFSGGFGRLAPTGDGSHAMNVNLARSNEAGAAKAVKSFGAMEEVNGVFGSSEISNSSSAAMATPAWVKKYKLRVVDSKSYSTAKKYALRLIQEYRQSTGSDLRPVGGVFNNTWMIVSGASALMGEDESRIADHIVSEWSERIYSPSEFKGQRMFTLDEFLEQLIMERNIRGVVVTGEFNGVTYTVTDPDTTRERVIATHTASAAMTAPFQADEIEKRISELNDFRQVLSISEKEKEAAAIAQETATIERETATIEQVQRNIAVLEKELVYRKQEVDLYNRIQTINARGAAITQESKQVQGDQSAKTTLLVEQRDLYKERDQIIKPELSRLLGILKTKHALATHVESTAKRAQAKFLAANKEELNTQLDDLLRGFERSYNSDEGVYQFSIFNPAYVQFETGLKALYGQAGLSVDFAMSSPFTLVDIGTLIGRLNELRNKRGSGVPDLDTQISGLEKELQYRDEEVKLYKESQALEAAAREKLQEARRAPIGQKEAFMKERKSLHDQADYLLKRVVRKLDVLIFKHAMSVHVADLANETWHQLEEHHRETLGPQLDSLVSDFERVYNSRDAIYIYNPSGAFHQAYVTFHAGLVALYAQAGLTVDFAMPPSLTGVDKSVKSTVLEKYQGLTRDELRNKLRTVTDKLLSKFGWDEMAPPGRSNPFMAYSLKGGKYLPAGIRIIDGGRASSMPKNAQGFSDFLEAELKDPKGHTKAFNSGLLDLYVIKEDSEVTVYILPQKLGEERALKYQVKQKLRAGSEGDVADRLLYSNDQNARWMAERIIEDEIHSFPWLLAQPKFNRQVAIDNLVEWMTGGNKFNSFGVPAEPEVLEQYQGITKNKLRNALRTVTDKLLSKGGWDEMAPGGRSSRFMAYPLKRDGYKYFPVGIKISSASSMPETAQRFLDFLEAELRTPNKFNSGLLDLYVIKEGQEVTIYILPKKIGEERALKYQVKQKLRAGNEEDAADRLLYSNQQNASWMAEKIIEDEIRSFPWLLAQPKFNRQVAIDNLIEWMTGISPAMGAAKRDLVEDQFLTYLQKQNLLSQLSGAVTRQFLDRMIDEKMNFTTALAALRDQAHKERSARNFWAQIGVGVANHQNPVEGLSSADLKLRLFGKEEASLAMNPVHPANPVGGIDLNAANLNLRIKRDGNGVPLPLGSQDPAMLSAPGFVPIINEIIPANLPMLSELKQLATQQIG